MARLTPQGIEPTTLEGYITALEAAFRDALGAAWIWSPRRPRANSSVLWR